VEIRGRFLVSAGDIPNQSSAGERRFSYFIAINVAIGAARSRDDVVCFRPDQASITCAAKR